ncbi:nucleolar complex protein 2 homolog [Anopheles marshallii]|uniref:nucleolar complex protein 2 homolog n=1 Tax=Anopheles marshallii TaxID=1521116 RepID=UPI00237BD0AF|nr:nucleolar complex protein 2 homolog [Anopheles marshallii]
MKIKQSKKKEDFQNMSLDNFLDNMDADVGDDEPEAKPKSKIKSNGIGKAKNKQELNNTKMKAKVGEKVKKLAIITDESGPSANETEKKKQKGQKGLLDGKKKKTASEGAPQMPHANGKEYEKKVKEKKMKPKSAKSEVNGNDKPTKRTLSEPEGSEDAAYYGNATKITKSKNKNSDKQVKEKTKKSKAKLSSGLNGKDAKKKKPQRAAAEDSDVVAESDSDSSEAESGMKQLEKEHKQALGRLETTDPELFAFLKQNDEKLLKFGQMEGSDSEFDDSSDEEAADDDEGNVHELPNKLEVASDESDFDPNEDDEKEEDEDDDEEGDIEANEDDKPGKKVTFKMLRAWTNDLTSLPVKHVKGIRSICKAFNSALFTITGDKSVIPPYRVQGSALFNGIVQTCVLYLGPAVRSYLSLNEKRQFKDLKNDRRFKKIKACLKMYLIDLTNLLANVSSSHIMSVILKHLHQFSPVLVCYQNLTKPILKRLISIWSTADEETIRVLAFMCILKITHAQQSHFLSNVLKVMYLAYIKNSKFVSPNTLPNINFMRRSLAEMFLLNFNVSYQHMFLYIRQLAIHLRNAVILQKKDSFQYIYNWQYINSLKLWGDVLGAAHAHGEALEPLIYPFVSITIGVIKLIPSAQYFPLRFHCCRILIQLNAKTNIYIPVLPFLVEVLRSHSFNEHHKKLSMRPVNLTCLLRFSPANIQENAFKDAVIDQIYELVLEFAANESASVGYPEIVLPIILQLRQYTKATHQYKYSRKMKQLSDKLMENYEFMEKLRSKMDIPLKETERIRAWEETVRAEGTPLTKFHATVAKETESVKRRHATDSENISDYKLPTLKKLQKKSQMKKDGPVTLFPSDDEDDDDDKIGFEGMEEDDDGDEYDDESMSDMEEDDDDATEMSSEGDEENEEEVSQNKNAKKSAKKQSEPQNTIDEEDYPLEDGADADQVDIVKDLKLDEWDD